MNDRWIKQVNGLEVSSFRPQCSKGTPLEEKSFNFDSIIWYKDLSSRKFGTALQEMTTILLEPVNDSRVDCF